MKIIISIVLTIILTNLTVSAEERLHVGDVRKLIKEGKLDSEKTCLDQYLKRRNHLWIATGLALPASPLEAIGGGFAGAGIGYGVSAVTGSALVGIVEPVLLGIYLGWLGGAAFAVGFEVSNIVKLVQNGFLINVIAAAKENAVLDPSLQKFLAKYLRSYKEDSQKIDAQKLAQILDLADQNSLLCDGSLTKHGKRKALRFKLADKKDLFKYIHSKL